MEIYRCHMQHNILKPYVVTLHQHGKFNKCVNCRRAFMQCQAFHSWRPECHLLYKNCPSNMRITSCLQQLSSKDWLCIWQNWCYGSLGFTFKCSLTRDGNQNDSLTSKLCDIRVPFPLASFQSILFFERLTIFMTLVIIWKNICWIVLTTVPISSCSRNNRTMFLRTLVAFKILKDTIK